MRGDGRKAKNPKKTFLRLLGYLKPYTPRLVIMVICIILSTVASVMSNASLETLIEDFVKPMLGQETPDFVPLIRFLFMMAGIYLAGMAATFLTNWLMVPVGQGIQRHIRNTMFTHMQKLPIRYFDTHLVGDVMSRYTSDIDTLRQMITQAIPQCITSAITIIVVFFAMLFTSPS
jgi:ATP-binding cassette subfamily B protein